MRSRSRFRQCRLNPVSSGIATSRSCCGVRQASDPSSGCWRYLYSSWGLTDSSTCICILQYMGPHPPYRLGSMISQLVRPMPENACGIGTLAGQVCSERAPVDIDVHAVLIYQYSCIHPYRYMHIQMHTSSIPIYVDSILSCVTSHFRSGVPFFRQHDSWLARGNGHRVKTLPIAKTGTKNSRPWGDSEPTSVHTHVRQPGIAGQGSLGAHAAIVPPN